MAEVLEGDTEESGDRRFVCKWTRCEGGKHTTDILEIPESEIRLFWVRGENIHAHTYEEALDAIEAEGIEAPQMYADLDNGTYPDILGIAGEYHHADENARKLLEEFRGTSNEWGKLWGLMHASIHIDGFDQLINGGVIAGRLDELKDAMLAQGGIKKADK
jgi:hypothetical protein